MTTENDLVLKLTIALKAGSEMRKAQKAYFEGPPVRYPYDNKTRIEMNRLQTVFDLRLAELKSEGVDLEGE